MRNCALQSWSFTSLPLFMSLIAAPFDSYSWALPPLSSRSPHRPCYVCALPADVSLGNVREAVTMHSAFVRVHKPKPVLRTAERGLFTKDFVPHQCFF